MVISSPVFTLPLVARGQTVPLAPDFPRGRTLLVTGGARRILELLVLTMERAETLDSLNL